MVPRCLVWVGVNKVSSLQTHLILGECLKINPEMALFAASLGLQPPYQVA